MDYHGKLLPIFSHERVFQVLDATLKHEVDMSEMTREMMGEIQVTTAGGEVSSDVTTGTSSDYSSDFHSSSSPSSLESKSPVDDDITSGDSESESKKVI